jgi:hypothetical protein
MSEIACSVVIVHPSQLFSEGLAGVVTTDSLKLEHISTDNDDIPFEKINDPPSSSLAAELLVTWRITCSISKNASAARAFVVIGGPVNLMLFRWRSRLVPMVTFLKR